MFWNPFAGSVAPSPWQEVARLQTEMNRIFGAFEHPVAPDFPRINVLVGEQCVRVLAEIPGVSKDAIEVSVAGDTLTLKGSRPAEPLESGRARRRQERRSGAFTRTIRLPFDIEADTVEAVHKNGILDIELPRATADRPRRIAVQSAR